MKYNKNHLATLIKRRLYGPSDVNTNGFRRAVKTTMITGEGMSVIIRGFMTIMEETQWKFDAIAVPSKHGLPLLGGMLNEFSMQMIKGLFMDESSELHGNLLDHNNRVLLVDDIVRTGNTLLNLAKMLGSIRIIGALVIYTEAPEEVHLDFPVRSLIDWNDLIVAPV